MLRNKGCEVNTAAADASKREATKSEIEQMQTIVRDTMAAGAARFASSTSPSTIGEGSLPMPSRLSSNDEMMALITAMGEGGKGVCIVTKGR